MKESHDDETSLSLTSYDFGKHTEPLDIKMFPEMEMDVNGLLLSVMLNHRLLGEGSGQWWYQEVVGRIESPWNAVGGKSVFILT